MKRLLSVFVILLFIGCVSTASDSGIHENVSGDIQLISPDARPSDGRASLTTIVPAAWNSSANTPPPTQTALLEPSARVVAVATPGPTVAPEPTATPEPTASPKPTATPKSTAKKKVTATPKATATPEPVAASEPPTEPVATLEPTASESSDEIEASSATPKPETKLPIQYDVYSEAGWEAVEADMFSYDFDLDGIEEIFSFKLDKDQRTTTILVGDTNITLNEGDNFISAILIDLDPASPHLNLLVVIDRASDDYETIELHLENGVLKRGKKIDGDCAWRDGALWFFERMDIFSTAFGKRTYSGDALTPNSEWLTMTHIPSVKEMETDRETLIELGILLHVIRELPCVIDGQETSLPEGTYIYRLRYNDKGTQIVVSTLDGVEAVIKLTNNRYEYLINGEPESEFFDNIFMAD